MAPSSAEVVLVILVLALVGTMVLELGLESELIMVPELSLGDACEAVLDTVELVGKEAGLALSVELIDVVEGSENVAVKAREDVEEEIVELEDCVPCLTARALSGVLEVAVNVVVEFFKLQ